MNDRPDGVGRNTARGTARFDVSLRLSRSFSFGPPTAPGGAGGGGRGGGGDGRPAGVPAGGGGLRRRARRRSRWWRAGRGPGGGGNPFGDGARFSAEVWISANNLLNRVNYLNYVGNLQSPFFGSGHVGGAGAPHRSGDELPLLAV